MGFFRLLLALSVVLSHFGPLFGLDFVGGKIAVQAFFIISGFYMTMILNEKYINKNNSFRLFITNRLIRLFPVYWCVLLIFIVISILYGVFIDWKTSPKIDSYFDVMPNLRSFIYLIFSNIFIIGQDILLFLCMDTSGSLFYSSTPNLYQQKPEYYLYIPQAWSISLELMFYFIAPFILRRKNIFVFSLIILSLILRIYLSIGLNLNIDPWTYRFFPNEIMFFLLGYFSYKIYLSKFKINPYLIGIVLFFYTIFYFKIPQLSFINIPFTINEICYFILIIVAIPSLFQKFKNNIIDIKIGELSYPVYLSHALVGGLVSKIIAEESLQIIFIIISTILFSILINKYITYPIEKYRQGRVK